MIEFETIRKEFENIGFTNLEAMGAADLILSFPDSKRLWQSEDVKRIIISIARSGMEPMSDQQKILVDGMAALTEKEMQSYYMYLFEELSHNEIGEKIGIGRKAVSKRIQNAQAKLAAAHQGAIDWKNDNRVREILEQVPERRRLCFSLRCIDGKSVAQTASQLNVTTWTVRGETQRAKNQLRSLLAANEQRNAL